MSNQVHKLSNVYLSYLLILFGLYSPVLLFSFGFSDDFESLFWHFTHGGLPSIQHEVSSGRPFFGLFRQIMVSTISSLPSLTYFRWIAFGFVSFYALFIHYFLIKREIFSNKALLFFFPLIMATLPSVQVFVSWLSCFSFILSSIFSGISYLLISSKKPKPYYFTLAFFCLAFSFGLYQSAALSFVFFWFVDVCVKPAKIERRKIIVPSLFLGLGVACSLFYVKVLPFLIYHEISDRGGFVQNIPYKLTWFLLRPFSYALSGHFIYLSVFSVVIGLVLFVFGLLALPNLDKKDRILRILLSLMTIPLSFSLNLIVAENSFSFRILIALSAIMSTISILGIMKLGQDFVSPAYRSKLVIALLAFVGVLSVYNLSWGMVGAQRSQYQAVKDVISQIPDNFTGKIYIKEMPEADYSTTYGEFGNLTALEGYSIRGMILTALRELGKPEELILKSGKTPFQWKLDNSSFEEGDFTIDLVEDVIKVAIPAYGVKKESPLKATLKSFISGEDE